MGIIMVNFGTDFVHAEGSDTASMDDVIGMVVF